MSRIPDIKDQLHFSNTQLGLLLFVAAAGALIALPLASRVIARIGSARTLLGGNVVLCVALPLLGTAHVVVSFGGIFLIGEREGWCG